MNEPTKDYRAELQGLLSNIEVSPTALEDRKQNNEMVSRETDLQIKRVRFMHAIAVVVALLICGAGIVGYVRWYFAFPLALVAFLAIFHAGRIIIGYVTIRRIRHNVIRSMRSKS